MLEYVSADGNTGAARFKRALHHFQDILVGIHFRAAGNHNRHRAAVHHFPEALDRPGVGNLYHICPHFAAKPCRMFYHRYIIFILNFFTPGINHGQQRKPPGSGLIADPAEVF